MDMRVMSPTMLAAAAALLLLGAGCRKEQPAAPSSALAPQPQPAAVPAPPSAPLVALAPTSPPPPDIPSIPGAPPSAADAIAPTPLPNSPRALAPQVIRILAKRWEFIPAEIRVTKGDRVVLEVSSLDTLHGISIPDFNINRVLAPGRVERIEFTATKVGRFDFVCSIVCGQEHRGMRGVLIVE